MNVKHSSASVRWFTPSIVIEAARATLGGIDLDPASEALANETVRATRYITEAENGITAPWGTSENPVSVFLNPPGGKFENKPLAVLFWRRMMLERSAALLTHGIFIAFSVELLQTSQRKDVPALTDFLVCVPHKRLAFIDPYSEEKQSPTHANAIAYVRGAVDRSDAFIHAFRNIGSFMVGAEYLTALRRG